jgi:hypothetical protein
MKDDSQQLGANNAHAFDAFFNEEEEKEFSEQDIDKMIDDMSDDDMEGGDMEDMDKKMESRKSARGKSVDYDSIINSALKSVKEDQKKKAVKYYVEMKRKAEKALQELFTGKYVIGKQGETGLDMSSVVGDKSFAVVDRAASGNQYTPTISESPYEPDKKHKGGKTGHATVVAEAKKAQRAKAYRQWLESQLSESDDAGADGEDFYQNQGILDNALSDNDEGGLEDFANIPEIMGQKMPMGEVPPASMGKSGMGEKKVRRQENAEVKFPSKEVEDDVRSSLNESFDFKKLVKGIY